MIIYWQIDDGYVTKRPPYKTVINDDELADYEEGPEREDFIAECIQEDFEQKISWYIVRG